MNDKKELQIYYSNMFRKYPDVVKPKDMQEMLPKMGKNKIYDLLRRKKIYSKKIGRDYYIPKISIIKYLIEK
jgi:hypothetical protein